MYKKKNWGKLESRNFFLEYFFWIINTVAKECKCNCTFLKFPWRLKGANPEYNQ